MYAKSLAPEKLVAHRGHQSRFPENSLLGFMDAMAAGAVNIECDIQITRDGVPVLYHDQDMQRLSGLKQAITDISAHQLNNCTVSESERLQARFINNSVNMLSELLPQIQKHQQIHFYLELKEESIKAHGRTFCLECLQSVLSQNGQINENIILISFDVPSVKKAKQYDFKKTALIFRDWQERNALLKEAMADFGFINYKRIPEDTDIIADKPLILYEIADLALAQTLINRGASAIETFCIRKMLNND